MDNSIVICFLFGLVLRMISFYISIKNEKYLRAHEALEYGKNITKTLALLHAVFYLAAFIEGYITKVQFDRITVIGLGLYGFSIFMLFFVIYKLSPFWTVKLFIAKDHQLNQSWLFRTFKHPNYFLNIIPELIGLALMLKSFWSFVAIFPIYLIILWIRIRQEEKCMHEKFANYE